MRLPTAGAFTGAHAVLHSFGKHAPALGAGKWKVAIRTQYGGGSNPLKEPRSVEFKGELTVETAS
ncbi:MAG: hypothetical protein LBP80_10550 [Treponema sp.]|nr:hypothetical protein [Treponema sp.]